MSALESALKVISGLLVREPVTIVRGIVELVRLALSQPDKEEAIARAKRAAVGKQAVETAVDQALKAKRKLKAKKS